MNNCEVEGCLRPAEISLMGGNSHDARDAREPECSIICRYHAGELVEYLAELGYYTPMEIHKPAKTLVDRSGRPLRFPKRKPHDNT